MRLRVSVCVFVFAYFVVDPPFKYSEESFGIWMNSKAPYFSQAESTWKKYGAFLNSFHPDAKWFTGRLERIYYKIGKSELSILFNQTCLKENMLIYIYMCSKNI